VSFRCAGASAARNPAAAVSPGFGVQGSGFSVLGCIVRPPTSVRDPTHALPYGPNGALPKHLNDALRHDLNQALLHCSCLFPCPLPIPSPGHGGHREQRRRRQRDGGARASCHATPSPRCSDPAPPTCVEGPGLASRACGVSQCVVWCQPVCGVVSASVWCGVPRNENRCCYTH